MLAKALLVALLLVLFSSPASAQFYVITHHSIEADIDAAGNAQLRERFFLQFPSEHDLRDFREKVGEIGVSLDGWKAFDGRIRSHIGEERDIVAETVSFVENNETYLEISYALNEPLMQKKQETSRVIDFGINTKFFNQFVDGSLWVIPENTSIAINLPSGIELQQPIEPEASVQGNRVEWHGYKYSNKLTVNYKVFKQIASFDLGAAVNRLLQSDVFWVVVAVIVIASALLLWKRKSIGGRIENYVIEHSELGEEEE